MFVTFCPVVQKVGQIGCFTLDIKTFAKHIYNKHDKWSLQTRRQKHINTFGFGIMFVNILYIIIIEY